MIPPYNILLVEDNEMDMTYYKHVLEEAGNVVFSAKDAFKAFEILHKENINLVISDIQLPQIDGFQLLHQIKEDPRTRQVNLILITGRNSGNDDMIKGFDEGAVDFLIKPIDPHILKAKVSVFKKMYEKNIQLIAHKNEIETLLHNILPKDTADELQEFGMSKARSYDLATVLFTDFLSFTNISETMKPELVVRRLNTYFSTFDSIIQKYHLEKIKTIGDAYLAVGGLPIRNKLNPITTVLAALEIRDYMLKINEEQRLQNETPWELRVGVHTGPIVAGVVGHLKWQYDIWGDTVNTCARLESACQPGEVNISESTYKYAKDFFECTHRGKLEAKNKGKIEMYFVNRLKSQYSEDSEGKIPNSDLLNIISFI